MTYALTKEDGDKILLEAGGFQLLETLKQIEVWQADWISTNPLYFQALSSHTIPPEGETAPDNLSAVIPSKGISWNTSDVNLGNLPYSVTINEYKAPDSQVGFEVVLKRKIGSTKYVRTFGYGPESASRTFPETTWLTD